MRARVEVPVVVGEGGSVPEYQTDGAAGMDLRLAEPVRLGPGERCLARTGLRVAIPEGYEGQVRPRSGLALRHGLSMVNSPGTIDSDYRGEVGLILINHGSEPVSLGAGERVAQLVVCAVERVSVVTVADLESTDRGSAGFGSTGVR